MNANPKLVRISVTWRERGAALIVSLLFLLIMTIVGITAMQVASLEERMSGNMRARSLAFQAAESALRTGETALGQALDNSNLPTIGCANGYYRLNDGNCDGMTDVQPLWNSVNWTSNAQVISGPVLAFTSATSAYIIEYMDTNTGGDSTCSNAGGCVCYYRLTARGIAGTSLATVIVQSIYTHPAVNISIGVQNQWKCFT